MRTSASIVAALVLACGSAAARAQSLAELAQKEKERRAAKAREAKPSGAAPKVITQDDLDLAKASRPPAEEPAAEPSAAAGSPSSPEEPKRPRSVSRSPAGIPDDSDERAAAEKSWRARAEASRAAVTVAEQAANSAQNYRDMLGPVPSPYESPSEWTREANAADARLGAAKVALAAAKKNLEDFEEEARRAGIPPGWLR